jgi:heterodisulfide reductase subunit A
MEQPRTGVYVCHCGSNIAGIVDVAAVRDFAAGLPGVVVARDHKYMCSDPGQNLIKDDIRNLKLNRIVVASCSPRMHEPTFRNACADAGLNPYLFAMANIRDHCSWVHDDREKATEKAKALVSGEVHRVYFQRPLENREVPVNPNVMVVGGGIAGIQAALEVANAGLQVYLVEKEPSIGGHMILLDKTFPTLDCSACILMPKMVSVAQHPKIKLLSYSEVQEVAGFVGNFKVKVRRKPRYVDEDKCTGCGLCESKCPWKTDSQYEMGMGKRKAIFRPFPQSIPNVPVIDSNICAYLKNGKCGICAKLCEAKAIAFDQKERIEEYEVGAIIVATGFQQFDPRAIQQYGYGRMPNVLTSLQFERLVNASGPTGGKIVLADGREPERVALIHCVGSRDDNHHRYCSRVCCMYSLKFAHILKERTRAEVYEFYIDLRCFGKGYEEFYHRLLHEGVNFIRGRPGEITDVPQIPEEQGKLVVLYEDTLIGRQGRLSVDMVVLGNALEARSDADVVARTFLLSRSPDGFFLERHPKLDPVAAMTDGIYIAGCCQGPKDIPDTVAQASAAAARAIGTAMRGKIELEGNTAEVNEDMCAGCKTCIALCPYNAISYIEDKKVARVNEALCKGCGTCVAACPRNAIAAKHFTSEQINAEIEGVLV